MFLVPVVVLGLGNSTFSDVTHNLRGHLETVLTEDYVRTARAKGARLWRHLYKDGFVMPLSSLVASKTPYMLGGAVIVEQVFNWPGMAASRGRRRSIGIIPCFAGSPSWPRW